MSKHRQPQSHSAVAGMILVVIGILFLFDTFHHLHLGRFIAHWWPLILIAAGIAKLRSDDRPGGGILVIIGAVCLSATLDIINWGSIWRFWPVILILVGLQIIFRTRGQARPWGKTTSRTDENYFNYTAIFSGGEHRIVATELRGGEGLALFGGLEIDLTAAAPADNCTFNLTALFGGIELLVPADWQIVTSGTPIFGSIANQTRAGVGPDTKTVYLNGTVLFGGIEIKNQPGS
ncbi:MAG: DUF5668 domain-containing protein [Candidatus Neomarinimicrobiota bacterium]